jgi:hypothetical protein
MSRRKHNADSSEINNHSRTANKQQRSPSQPVNQRHREKSGSKVHKANHHRLERTGDTAESG